MNCFKNSKQGLTPQIKLKLTPQIKLKLKCLGPKIRRHCKNSR